MSVRERQRAGMDCTDQTPDRFRELSGPALLQEPYEQLRALGLELAVVDFDAVSELGCASLRSDAGLFNTGVRDGFCGIRADGGISVRVLCPVAANARGSTSSRASMALPRSAQGPAARVRTADRAPTRAASEASAAEVSTTRSLWAASITVLENVQL